jgi:hypothetical protein
VVADDELGRDLGIEQATSHEDQDFPFPPCERLDPLAQGRIGLTRPADASVWWQPSG